MPGRSGQVHAEPGQRQPGIRAAGHDGRMWPVAFRLDGRERYLLWIAGEAGDDEVLADGDRALVFGTLQELHQHATGRGIELEDTDAVGVVDIDAAEQWCRTQSTPDAGLLLTVWNLCGDVARGTRRLFDDRGEDRDRVYDVVFFANNLPSMTPAGESFVPDWTTDDLETLREVIRSGVTMFRSAGA